MSRLVRNKYLTLKNYIRALAILQTQNFILICGVALIVLGVMAKRFAQEHMGDVGYDFITWKLLHSTFSASIIMIFAIVGISLILAVNKFYTKNIKKYQLLPIAKSTILQSELVQTCSLLTVIGGGLLVAYGLRVQLQNILILQLLGCLVAFEFTNIIFPIIFSVYFLTKLKRMSFFVYGIMMQILVVGQNLLLYKLDLYYLYFVCVILELVIVIGVALQIKKGRILLENSIEIVEEPLHKRRRRLKARPSLMSVIVLENLDQVKILLQFLLIPIAIALGLKFLGLFGDMEVVGEFFAFIPAFFAAVYSSYRKQYLELPIREKKNIIIRFFLGLFLMIVSYLLTNVCIHEPVDGAYLLDTILLSIILFTIVIKLQIKLISEGKENPMFYLFLGIVVLIYQYLRNYFLEVGYLLFKVKIPIYSPSLLVAVLCIIVLLL